MNTYQRYTDNKLFVFVIFMYFVSTLEISASTHFSLKTDTTSLVQILHINTLKRDTVLRAKTHLEAPNWHPDNYLLLNKYGKLFTFDLSTQQLSPFSTGNVNKCNNDHGFSPDHKWLAISSGVRDDSTKKSYRSAIFIMPMSGGTPRRITPLTPSYWHGWSPKEDVVAFCAERNGNYDIYTMSAKGGEERRLTSTEGLDDGPDYSADGKYIYFNSYRSGHMQIWRMLADGTKPEQLTFDANSNWFPHPSPDHKWIVFISYITDEKQQHLFGKQVKLRLMNLETKEIRDLTEVFYGGQGTINVPSWSSDSKRIAFVSYEVR